MFHNSILEQRQLSNDKSSSSNSVESSSQQQPTQSVRAVPFEPSLDLLAANQIQEASQDQVLPVRGVGSVGQAPVRGVGSLGQAPLALRQRDMAGPRDQELALAGTREVTAATSAAAPLKAGKTISTPPKHYELYKIIPQTVELCYKAVATFSYACFFLVRDDFLVWDDGTDMRPTIASLNKPYLSMVYNVLSLRNYDFMWLREPRLDYASQSEISGERVKAATACAIFYGNDIGLCVRFFGGDYIGSWRDADAILAAATPHVQPEILAAMERILKRGAPSRFNWEEPAENKQAFLERGNNPSIERNRASTDKTMNKEERNSHVIPFMSFIVLFSAFARITPQHLLNKFGKKDRLIWDGKTKLFPKETTMNEATPIEHETPVMFGIVYMTFITWIWNMRISYPDEDILLAFMDISSCFRFPRIFADLAGAFGFVIGDLFFAANAMVFGSIASASSWEPFRVAIAALGTAYFMRAELVELHQELLDMIGWAPSAGAEVVFTQARACTKNKGVFDEDGQRVPTPHHVYVDDDLIADVRSWMPTTLVAGIEAIFTIMGRPALHLRQCALSIEKWRALRVAHVQILLGILFDTRKMTVGTVPEFRQEVLELLRSWKGKHFFRVDEMEKLVGKLGRIGQSYRAIYHLMPHMYSSVAYALRENEAFLVSTSRRFRRLIKVAKQMRVADIEHDERDINFAIGQVARMTHRCEQQYRMPPSLIDEIEFITKIIEDESIELSTPIAHIVPRDVEYDAAADSCKESGGGWSTDLSFWWYLAYPAEIVRRARLENNKAKQLISINALEMLCVIINLAAAIYACWFDGIDMADCPVLRNWCDNAAATCWVNKKCKESLIGRALGRFFCGLLMSTNLGIQAEWLSSESNKIADEISRVKKRGGEYDFSQLLTNNPLLHTCRQFQPSDYLLGLLWDVLLKNGSPDPLILKNLKPETLGSFISSSS
jgi:hypothetical protein